MSEDYGLKIKVGADVKEGVSGLKQVGDEAKNAATKIGGLGTPVDKAGKQLRELSSTSYIARNGVLELGHVFRDLPYAMNNVAVLTGPIDRMVQSLTVLKQETGSIGGAFKALGASLAGGGGLLIGFELITSALTIFGGKLLNAKSDVDEAAEATKKFGEAQHQTAVKIQEQQVNIESLVRVARGDIGTKAEQAAALEKLNKLIPDSVGHLTKQNIVTQEGISIIRNYTRALEDQATAELLTGRAAELRVKQLDDQKKFTEDLKVLYTERAKQAQLIDDQDRNTADGGAGRGAALALRMQEIQNQISQRFQEYVSAGKIAKKTLDELRAEIDKNTAGSVILDVKDPKVKDGKVKVKDKTDVELSHAYIDLKIDNLKDMAKEVNEKLDLKKTFGKFGGGNVVIDQGLMDQASKMRGEFDAMQDRADKLSGVLTSKLAPAFESVFETMINGGGNAIKMLGEAIKQIVVKLISAAITAAIFAAIIGAATGGASFGGGAKNFAGGFQNMFSQLGGIPKFAKGGIVTGPTLGLVGEAGPEVIFPLDKLNQFASNSGGGQTFIPDVKIQGNDLLVVFNRAQKNQKFV